MRNFELHRGQRERNKKEVRWNAQRKGETKTSWCVPKVAPLIWENDQKEHDNQMLQM